VAGFDIFSVLKSYGRRQSLEDLGLYILPQAVPPRNATFVDKERSVIVPLGIPGPPPVPGTALAFEYRVPANRRGILARLGVDCVDPAALPSIQFSVLRSGAPVPNYVNVQAPIGTIGVPDTVHQTFDGDQLLQIQIANFSAFDLEVHVRVVAWFWDVIEEYGR
jgi:hypothetical protein